MARNENHLCRRRLDTYCLLKHSIDAKPNTSVYVKLCTVIATAGDIYKIPIGILMWIYFDETNLKIVDLFL